MKVKYNFPVKSISRITEPFPLLLGEVEYFVSTDQEGKIHQISVVMGVDDASMWPTAVETPNSETKFNITMHSPFLDDAQQAVRTAEGVLSSFGVQSISWNEPEEEYIPESDDEREQLGVLSMSVSRGRASLLDREPVPFSVVAAALIRAKELAKVEVPLAFFRKGTNDCYEDRHIEACVNFLFMLENLFANGKFKTKSVLAEYSSRKELVLAVQETQADRDLVQIAHRWGRPHGIKMEERYYNVSPSDVVKTLVGLRGLLHHQTSKEDRWHPDQHDEFLVDALFLNFVCSKVAFGLFSAALFSDETRRDFVACIERARSFESGIKSP